MNWAHPEQMENYRNLNQSTNLRREERRGRPGQVSIFAVVERSLEDGSEDGKRWDEPKSRPTSDDQTLSPFIHSFIHWLSVSSTHSNHRRRRPCLEQAVLALGTVLHHQSLYNPMSVTCTSTRVMYRLRLIKIGKKVKITESTADWSAYSDWYFRKVQCCQCQWFNRRMHQIINNKLKWHILGLGVWQNCPLIF